MSISVRANDGARPDLAALRATLKDLNGETADTRADFDTTAADAKIAAFKAELKDIGNPDVKPDMDLGDVDDKLKELDDKMKERLDKAKEDVSKLGEFAARAAEGSEKAAEEESEARADRLSSALEKLNETVAKPKVSVEGITRSTTELAGVHTGLDRVKNDTERLAEDAEKEGTGGLIGRLLLGRNTSGGGAIGGLLEKIPLIGGNLSNITETLGSLGTEEGPSALKALGSIGGSAGGIAAVGGIIGAAVTEVGGLATGLTAAGLGIGGFAALAIPTFKTIFGAVGDTAAQLAKLPAPIRMAAIEVKNVEGQFSGMAKAFQPEVVRVFSQALGIVSDHMNLLLPLAQSVTPALSGVLAMFSNGLNSPQFKYFMSFMESLAGPVLIAVGSGMKGLVGDVMKLMESFSKKDVLNSVHIAFRLIGAAITVLIAIIRISMAVWDAVTLDIHATAVAFDIVRHAVAVAARDIAAGFDLVRHAAAELGHDTAAVFDKIRHTVASWAHDVAHDFDAVRSAISGAVTKAVDWVENKFDAMRDGVKTRVGQLVSFVRGLPHQLLSALASLPGLMLQAGKKAIEMLIQGLESIPVIGPMVKIAGDIADHLPHSPAKKGPLSGAGSPDKSGEAIMRMLTQGLTAGAPGVTQTMARALSGVTHVRPGSAGGYGAYGAGAGGTQRIELVFSGNGSDALLKWLRNEIRARGGNVQQVIGTGKA